ncbi:MAG TPA: FecR domain-containing protein [Opitutaceae bacterium]|nr:FecR domain-containing protein [Opitutaceae bacterium]
MTAPEPHDDIVDVTASHWLARQDRELTAAEQDEYLQWLAADPAHGRAVARLRQAWRRLDGARQWRPGHSRQPNPDLLRARARRLRWWPAAIAAAGAAAMLAVYCWEPTPAERPRAVLAHTGPEQVLLEDGSAVELNTGAEIQILFTDAERRVRLLRGEAHFTVARNPARPFVVAADHYAVTALGTAFAVNFAPSSVSVVVTEGKVQLSEAGAATAAERELSRLVAGQQAVIRRPELGRPASVQISDLSRPQLEKTLAWQAPRLEFAETPLRDVITEFNRYNATQLVLADEATGRILVGGSFRADSVESFVRLLEAGFGVGGERRGPEIVLRERR